MPSASCRCWVELWVSAGEGGWDPQSLGVFVGAAVYRALRHA